MDSDTESLRTLIGSTVDAGYEVFMANSQEEFEEARGRLVDCLELVMLCVMPTDDITETIEEIGDWHIDYERIRADDEVDSGTHRFKDMTKNDAVQMFKEIYCNTLSERFEITNVYSEADRECS